MDEETQRLIARAELALANGESLRRQHERLRKELVGLTEKLRHARKRGKVKRKRG